MIINKTALDALRAITLPKAGKASSVAAPLPGADRVNISNRATEAASVLNAIKDLPEVLLSCPSSGNLSGLTIE